MHIGGLTSTFSPETVVSGFLAVLVEKDLKLNFAVIDRLENGGDRLKSMLRRRKNRWFGRRKAAAKCITERASEGVITVMFVGIRWGR